MKKWALTEGNEQEGIKNTHKILHCIGTWQYYYPANWQPVQTMHLGMRCDE